MRKINTVLHGYSRSDGAGVILNRLFSHYEKAMFAPFIQMDFIDTDNPYNYLPGFPWHSHSGVEIITCLIEGEMHHKDNIGNETILRKGDVQALNAGREVYHHEKPQYIGGKFIACQIWMELPSILSDAPAGYQMVEADKIPVIVQENNVSIKVLAGSWGDITGGIRQLANDTNLWLVEMPEHSTFIVNTNPEHTLCFYLFCGRVRYEDDPQVLLRKGQIVNFGYGEQLKIMTDNSKARFILASAQPILSTSRQSTSQHKRKNEVLQAK